MNIEEIKKKVTDYKSELIRSRECCEVVDLSDETLYLLSIIEQASKALQYYADLNKHAYHDAIQGELYSDWWLRQSDVAVEALKAIREG